MSQQSRLVTFSMICPEPRAWLVVTSDHGNPRVVEMRRLFPSNWSASVQLPPGEYRCRYYGGDDRNILYFGAAAIEGSINCGMDALLLVNN